MINKINFTPAYNTAFKGEKEVKMLVEKTNELPPDSNDITNFGFDLSWMLKDKEISRQDIGEAAKQIKEEWKANLLKLYAKKD